MAREPEPHPDTDQTGETIEFAPIQTEFIWHEASHDSEVVLGGLYDYPVEIRIGQTTETSPLFIERGVAYEELCEAEGVEPADVCVLVQPDVMAENPHAGWLIIRRAETVHVGRVDTPQFRLGNDVGREKHVTIANRGGTQREISVVAHSSNPTRVRVKSDFAYSDRKFMW